MDNFERFAQSNIYVEESDMVPIIIKYSDSNEKRYNEKNVTSFKQAIKDYEGIHPCVFINDGISKGRNARSQFLIVLEDNNISLRVQVEGHFRSFFGPTLLTNKPITPNDPSESIKRRCNIRIVDNGADEIEIAEQMQWGDRLQELKSFITSVSGLKRPLKEIRKEEDQEIWASYAEGLEALTKAKQELHRIIKTNKIHTEKNRRKENVKVISLEIESTTNAQDLKRSIYEVLDGNLVKPRFETDEKGKECSIIYDGLKEIAEDELHEFISIAEQSCYKMKTALPQHVLNGAFTFKSGEAENESIISEFDSILKDYDPKYPQKEGRRYSFDSDRDALHAKNILQQRFKNILKCSQDTNLTVSFIEEGSEDMLQSIKELFDNAKVIEKEKFFIIQTSKPIEHEKLNTYSSEFFNN